MCGRYVSASPPDEVARYFGTTPASEPLPENYNVAPTAKVYAVRAVDGRRSLDSLVWGLVPNWSKNAKGGARMINARAETAPDKPAFRRAFRTRRCLVPADGFYEWAAAAPGVSDVGRTTRAPKQPYFVHRTDGEPLALAGMWERWYPKDADGRDLSDAPPLETCTVITTEANALMHPVHDRMPVLLAPAMWDTWLDPDSDPDGLRPLLRPAPEGLLSLRPVSTQVNDVRHGGPELLEPTGDEISGPGRP
jgi:putative SOS response-associated peptidase YedK